MLATNGIEKCWQNRLHYCGHVCYVMFYRLYFKAIHFNWSVITFRGLKVDFSKYYIFSAMRPLWVKFLPKNSSAKELHIAIRLSC